jgi:protocatechuate 3,4-dioxygenase beta subunit
MSEQQSGKPSRRAVVVVGGAVAAAGVGAYALWRGAPTGFGNAAPRKAVSYSFESSNQCVLSATMTEGPFYVDEALVRRDIRDGREGAELALRLKIVDAATCAALPGAAVDLWHCDAQGNYSATSSANENERFLRGRQIAGADGIVEFVTIYPGWYSGRTPHIHLKVFVGTREVATSQLFFPDELSAKIYAKPPYAARGRANTTNGEDGVLRGARGADGAWPTMVEETTRLKGTLTVGVARA